MSDWKITLLANEHCATGENPLWDDERGCVYWTDIPAGKLFRYDLATNLHEQIYSGPPVGGFTLQADGSLLLFRVNDIATLPWGGEARPFLQFQNDGSDRFNDVCADPEGRVFAGTLNNKREKRAGLFRMDLDGTITRLFNETGNSNGCDFSSDEQTFFWTDSTAKQICKFDYDRATGALANKKIVCQFNPDAGTPDGLCIDAAGDLWSARYRGGAIFQFAPDGTPLGKIELPTPLITCGCFGGSSLDTMFVTTAKAESDDMSGALFRIEGPFRGKAKFRSRILL